MLSIMWTEAEPTGAKSCGELSLALRSQRHLQIHLARCQLRSSLHWSTETERKKAERGSGGRRQRSKLARKKDGEKKSVGGESYLTDRTDASERAHARETERKTEREGKKKALLKINRASRFKGKGRHRHSIVRANYQKKIITTDGLRKAKEGASEGVRE